MKIIQSLFWVLSIRSSSLWRPAFFKLVVRFSYATFYGSGILKIFIDVDGVLLGKILIVIG